MKAVQEGKQTSPALMRNALGTWDIFFFVVAAAAPLTVMAGVGPLAFRLGGVGAPGGYVAAGIVLILFAAGFTAMSKYVKNAGALYAYIANGLGKPIGSGAAVIAIYSYTMVLVGFYGAFGFFASLTVADLFGLSVTWWIWALAGAVATGYLGYRQIGISARVLSILLVCESAILVVLAIAVLLRGRPEPLSLAPLAPWNVFSADAGALFIFGFGAFVGFEATAIYAEEARDPGRTVPRATYIAVGFLAVFYGFIMWSMTAAWGVKGIMVQATSDNVANIVFGAGTTYLGRWSTDAMRILIMTSLFAAVLAFHNAVNRYFFVLGREGVIPAVFGRTHAKTKSPWVAGLFQTVLAIVAVLVVLAFGWDPYLRFALYTNASGIIGILLLQALCSAAVIVYFLRDRRGHSLFRVLVAPALSAVGLTAGCYLTIARFSLLTGQTGVVNWLLLLPIPIAFAIGVLIAVRIRASNRARYQQLTQTNVFEAE